MALFAHSENKTMICLEQSKMTLKESTRKRLVKRFRAVERIVRKNWSDFEEFPSSLKQGIMTDIMNYINEWDGGKNGFQETEIENGRRKAMNWWNSSKRRPLGDSVFVILFHALLKLLVFGIGTQKPCICDECVNRIPFSEKLCIFISIWIQIMECKIKFPKSSAKPLIPHQCLVVNSSFKELCINFVSDISLNKLAWEGSKKKMTMNVGGNLHKKKGAELLFQSYICVLNDLKRCLNAKNNGTYARCLSRMMSSGQTSQVIEPIPPQIQVDMLYDCDRFYEYKVPTPVTPPRNTEFVGNNNNNNNNYCNCGECVRKKHEHLMQCYAQSRGIQLAQLPPLPLPRPVPLPQPPSPPQTYYVPNNNTGYVTPLPSKHKQVEQMQYVSNVVPVMPQNKVFNYGTNAKNIWSVNNGNSNSCNPVFIPQCASDYNNRTPSTEYSHYTPLTSNAPPTPFRMDRMSNLSSNIDQPASSDLNERKNEKRNYFHFSDDNLVNLEMDCDDEMDIMNMLNEGDLMDNAPSSMLDSFPMIDFL